MSEDVTLVRRVCMQTLTSTITLVFLWQCSPAARVVGDDAETPATDVSVAGVDAADSHDFRGDVVEAGVPDALVDLQLGDGPGSHMEPDAAADPPDCIEPDFELYAVPDLSVEPTLIEVPGPLHRNHRYEVTWIFDPTPTCAPEAIWFRGRALDAETDIPMHEFPGRCDDAPPDDILTISAYFCPVYLGEIEITMGFFQGFEQFPVRTKNFVVIE